MSFLDDLLDFGAGALDSVGEHADWLFGQPDQSTNPQIKPQANHPQADAQGNPVTRPQGQPVAAFPPWMVYAGAGLGAVTVLLLLMMAIKER
ncbi:hypothetical protein [Enterovibrio norvegicus]|uniref:hypothetical protein n=1 Tax=Enterovibrio norvegicus TaxID=188144 RepID=UPI0024B11CD5|nr:hypothetical protein [Enterovibrio norvegicus]